MRVRIAGLMVAAVLTVSSVAVRAASGADDPKEVIANGSLWHTVLAEPVYGQPYSAVQVHTIVRTLADGTKITHDGHHNVARDSQGRVRVEVRMAVGQNGQPDTVMVYVVDPVAHTLTTWRTGPLANKVATEVKFPEEKRLPVKPEVIRVEDGRPQPVVTTENLGTDTIDGLPVEVVKTTTVVPAGRSHNDAPITKTVEKWTSVDLKLVMKEEWTDPRMGVRTISLENFSRSEPDAALFRVPAGYQVKQAKEVLKELADKLNEAAQN
jgi:hypothetical protein